MPTLTIWQDEEKAEMFSCWLRYALMNGGYTPVLVALAEAMESVSSDGFERFPLAKMEKWFEVAAKLRAVANE